MNGLEFIRFIETFGEIFNNKLFNGRYNEPEMMTFSQVEIKGTECKINN